MILEKLSDTGTTEAAMQSPIAQWILNPEKLWVPNNG
jgi:hypothetical protein